MKNFVIVLLVFILAGCASSKINVVKKLEAGASIGAGEGIVIARVINASPYTKSFNYLTLAPKGVYESDEEKYQRLPALQELDYNATVFVSPVKAGVYSLSDLYSYHQFGEYYYQKFASMGPDFGTFRVADGSVTDLGTLIYYHKPDGERYHTVVTRTDDKGDSWQDAQRYAPQLVASSATAERLGWDADDLEGERYDNFLNVVQNPVIYNSRIPVADGALVFTSKLGMLLNRDATGEWSLQSVDSFHDLTNYNKNARGDVLLADGKGKLFRRQAGQPEWQTINLDTQGANIRHLHLGEDSQSYVILSTDKYLLLGQLSESDPTVLREMLYYTKGFGWVTPDDHAENEREFKERLKKSPEKKPRQSKYKHFSVVDHRGKTYLTVDQRLYRLDYGRSAASDVATDFKPQRISQVGSDQLVISRVSAWDGSVQTKYTLDEGLNWHTFTRTIDTCPGEEIVKKSGGKIKCADNSVRYRKMQHASIPVFYSDNTGYSIVTKTDVNIWKGERKTTYFMVTSRDAGKTWLSHEAELPKHCASLFKGKDENELILSCEQATGQFFVADKNNINWALEYKPALF